MSDEPKRLLEGGPKRLVGAALNHKEDASKPFVVLVHWCDGLPPVEQPVSETELLSLFNEIVRVHKPVLETKLV